MFGVNPEEEYEQSRRRQGGELVFCEAGRSQWVTRHWAGVHGVGIFQRWAKRELPLMEGLMRCYADALGLSLAGNGASQAFGQGSEEIWNVSVIWGNGNGRQSENMRGRQVHSEAIPAKEERSNEWGHRSR